MNQSKNDGDNKNKHLSCDICKKEIPPSAGLTPEGSDYVRHFCGLECLEEWRKKNNEKQS